MNLGEVDLGCSAVVVIVMLAGLVGMAVEGLKWVFGG